MPMTAPGRGRTRQASRDERHDDEHANNARGEVAAQSSCLLFVLVLSVALLVSSAGAAPASSRTAARLAAVGGITLTPVSGSSSPMSFPPPPATSEVFSGSAVGSNLLGTGGTQVAVGVLNGCVYIYDLGDLTRAPCASSRVQHRSRRRRY